LARIAKLSSIDRDDPVLCPQAGPSGGSALGKVADHEDARALLLEWDSQALPPAACRVTGLIAASAVA
jgi:hypothetical protein